MKLWHAVILVVVVALVASKYPSIGQSVLGKVGL